jgi:hypothetical protein
VLNHYVISIESSNFPISLDSSSTAGGGLGPTPNPLNGRRTS